MRVIFHSVWVDKFCCYAYTLAVVLRPSGLVVKGKSSGPGTKMQGTGQVKSGRNGAPAPQSRASLSAVRRCSSLLGVKRQRGVPGSSFRFGDLFCSCTRRALRGTVWAARKINVATRRVMCRATITITIAESRGQSADVFTTSAPRARANSDENEISRAGRMPGKARSVRTRVYADAEEAEFRAEKSSARATDEQR